jgi:hypothetical protein
MTRSRTLKVVAVAAAAAFAVPAVSGCSTHPGQAAVIGSESVADSKLDDVASALCAAQSAGQQTSQAQQLASRAARQGALDVLINGSLSRQYGASRGVVADQEKVSSALASNAQTIATLPASSRRIFRDTLREYAEGQLMLISIGKGELAKRGQQNATDQQAVAAGTKLRDAWAKRHLTVSVDPRYGTFSQGALRASHGSLSVPVSARAVDGDKQSPSSSWVSSLPASQKCS